MANYAFLVEGALEQIAIQRMCPKTSVRLIGVNGDACSVNRIFERVKFHIKTLRRHRRVYVIFDREKRSETCDVLRSDLSRLIAASGFDVDVKVHVIDRCIESWFLYFVSDRGEIDYELPCRTIDSFAGVHGKAELKRLLRKSGISYHETQLGVEMLTRIKSSKLAGVSNDFAILRRMLPVGCSFAVSS